MTRPQLTVLFRIFRFPSSSESSRSDFWAGGFFLPSLFFFTKALNCLREQNQTLSTTLSIHDLDQISGTRSIRFCNAVWVEL